MRKHFRVLEILFSFKESSIGRCNTPTKIAFDLGKKMSIKILSILGQKPDL